MKKRSELSLNELKRISSILKGALIGFGTLGLLSAIVLYFLEANTVLFIPVMVFPIIALPMVISLKSINDEMSSRNSKSPVEL
jgi:hypothetical protein